MTRKCVLCKKTNYKNSYSFFSAPKDPETRQKWQVALAIKNYTVTDETYVCSKHFRERDVITHWVSGVPPHTVTIKYKKFRLRPGAVPVNNVDDDDKDDNGKQSSASNLDSENDDQYRFNCSELNKQENEEQTENVSEITCDISITNIEDDIKLTKGRETLRNMDSKLSNLEFNNTISSEDEYHLKVEEEEEEANIGNVEERSNWKHIVEGNNIREECIGQDGTKMDGNNCYMEQELLNTLDNDHLDTQDYSTSKEISENQMLFEDLLEICSEISLPQGWSCVVTSKGHGTTIVYLKMNVTKTGMPFIQKQVFIKTDMILRCSVMDKEIDPFTHHLIKDGRESKVRSPSDIQEFVNEFDQRRVCKGVNSFEGFQGSSNPKVMFNDGSKWKHIHCSVIVNNDAVRCSRCILLSQALKRKFKQRLSSSHNSAVLANQQKKISKQNRCIVRCVKQ